MDDMPFETFKRQRAPLVSQPYVTVQRKGVISLNRAAYDSLGEPETVELMFDREERLIGVRKVEPTIEHAYLVRGNGTKARSFLIAGTAFTNYYEIDVSVARRWPAEVVDGTLVVDLKEPGTEIVSNRSLGEQRKAARLEPEPVPSYSGGQEPGSALE